MEARAMHAFAQCNRLGAWVISKPLPVLAGVGNSNERGVAAHSHITIK